MSGKFDPARHLRQLRNRQGGTTDYLDTKFKLLWLRAEHPEALVETKDIAIEPDFDNGVVEATGERRPRGRAIFRATVAIPGGGSATGYGSETASDFGDWLEKAETKALGRALAALGFAAESIPELWPGQQRPVTVARRAPSAQGDPATQPASEGQKRQIRALAASRGVTEASLGLDAITRETAAAVIADLKGRAARPQQQGG